MRSEWWTEGKVGREDRVSCWFDFEVRVMFVEGFGFGVFAGGVGVAGGGSDILEGRGEAGVVFAFVLRLKANLDLGAADARRSSSSFSKVFNCCKFSSPCPAKITTAIINQDTKQNKVELSTRLPQDSTVERIHTDSHCLWS